MFTTPWGNDTIKRDLYGSGSEVTYYPGSMVCLRSDGYATKAADTAGLRFDGIVADAVRTTVFAGDSSGDRKVTVQRPWRFSMAIAAATIADIGTAVYALYDNQVALAAGVSNSVHVGWIDAIVSSTEVVIRPVWAGTRGEANFDGGTLTFDEVTGSNVIAIPDNLADALSVKQGANAYLTFVSTNSAELIYSSKKLRFVDSAPLTLGTGDDIVLTWDGTDLDVTQATANSSIKWGVDGAGIDQVWYGDTASTNMTWDQSADALIFTGACDLQFTGTTGQPEIVLTDNLADALSVKISGGADLIVFKTTNSAEEVTIPNSLGVGTDATDRVTIKGIYMSPSNVVVAVPTIADAESDEVAVDVSGAFSMAPAVGDAVIAIPQEALPTDCLFNGARVTATDTITVSFGTKEGGSGVTGANKNFKFLVFDLT